VHTVPTPTCRTPSPGRLRACRNTYGCTSAEPRMHRATGNGRLRAQLIQPTPFTRERITAFFHSVPRPESSYQFYWWGMLREYPLFVALNLRTRIEHDHAGTLLAFFQNLSEAALHKSPKVHLSQRLPGFGKEYSPALAHAPSGFSFTCSPLTALRPGLGTPQIVIRTQRPPCCATSSAARGRHRRSHTQADNSQHKPCTR